MDKRKGREMKAKGQFVKLKSGEHGVIHKVSIVRTEKVYQIFTEKGLTLAKENDIQ
jgi:hypothetical protein